MHLEGSSAERGRLGWVAIASAARHTLDRTNASSNPRAVRRAETLTRAQRAAVELITELDIYTNNNDVDHWMPRRLADRRRWLGLGPAGPLKKLYSFTLAGTERTEPGWRALRLLERAESESDAELDLVAPWLATVPLVERLAMWGMVNLGRSDVWGIREHAHFDARDKAQVAQLGPEVAAWATHYADEILAAHAAGRLLPSLPDPAIVAYAIECIASSCRAQARSRSRGASTRAQADASAPEVSAQTVANGLQAAIQEAAPSLANDRAKVIAAYASIKAETNAKYNDTTDKDTVRAKASLESRRLEGRGDRRAERVWYARQDHDDR